MEQSRSSKEKRKTDWNTCLRRLVLIFLGLFVGIRLYYANAKGIMGNELPMPFGVGVANVLSGSMEPTFSKGTLLFIRKKDQVDVGDIVVYQSGKHLVVHRIIEIQGDTVTTQGDANNAADPPFDRSEIRGVVVWWIPRIGDVIGKLRSPAGIIVILACVFLLTEASFRVQEKEDDEELDNIRNEIKKLKKK